MKDKLVMGLHLFPFSSIDQSSDNLLKKTGVLLALNPTWPHYKDAT